LFLHDLEVQLAYFAAVQRNALIAQKVRDGAIGLLHPLIGFDVDQGSVDIEEHGPNLHHGVRNMILASSTSRRRCGALTQELRAMRRSVRAIWKGSRPVMERNARSRSGKWQAYSQRKCPMKGSAACLFPVACK